MTGEKTINCYGVPLTLGPRWIDDTLFRFALPPREVPAGTPLFRTNMIIARRAAAPNLTLPDVLRGLESSAPPKHVTDQQAFKVRDGHLAKQESTPVDAPPEQLGSGFAAIGGREAVWLDVSFFSVEAKRRLYQRQIITLPQPETMLVLTLTADDSDLDHHAKELGFARK